MIKSLRTRLVLYIVLIIGVFSALITGASIYQMRTNMLRDMQTDFSKIVDIKTELITTWVSAKQSFIQSLAAQQSHSDILESLKATAEAGGFASTYVGYSDDTAIFTNDWQPPSDYKVTEKEWFKKAMENPDTVVMSYPYLDAETNYLTVTFSKTFKLSNGKQGVVAGDLFINEQVKSLFQQSLRGNGYFFLLDDTGKIIYHPSVDLKPSASTPGTIERPHISNIAPNINESTLPGIVVGTHLQELMMNNTMMYLNINRVPNTNWLIGVATPKEAVLAPINLLLTQIIIGTLLAFILVVPLLAIVIGKMLNGLIKLRDAMKNLAKGEVDLTSRLNVKGEDEIAETAQSFDRFMNQLNGLFLQLRKECGQVIQDVKQASNLTADVKTSALQVERSTQENSDTLNKISDSISSITSESKEVDSIITQTSQSLNLNAKQIDDLHNDMRNTTKNVQELERILNQLDNRSGEISSITNIIHEIASQTNLLALNAAIEAARAGEQGRGFAVVADEVRRLAERTSTATVEITDMISAIRDESEVALKNVQKTVEIVESGTNLTATVLNEITNIQQSVMVIDARMTSITDETATQNTAILQVSQRSNALNAQLHTTLENITSELEHISDSTARLSKEVNQFKTH